MPTPNEETLQTLQNTLTTHQQAAEEAYAAMNDDKANDEDFRAASELFEQSTALAQETADKIKALNAQTGRAATLAKAAELKAKQEAHFTAIQKDLLRPQNQRARQRMAREHADGSRSFEKTYKDAMAVWMCYDKNHELNQFTDEERNLCEKFGINPASDRFRVTTDGLDIDRMLEARGRMFGMSPMMGIGGATDPIDSRDTGSFGLFNRAPEVSNRLMSNMYAQNGILRSPVEVVNSSEITEYIEGFTDDTANTGSQSGEGRDVFDNAKPTGGEIIWRHFQYNAKSLEFTYMALRKNRYELLGQVSQMLGTRLGQLTGRLFTTGTGVNECEGLLTAAVRGGRIMDTATTNAIVVGEVEEMARNGVDDYIYQEEPSGLGWMMHKETAVYIAGLKDGEGRPFFQMGREEAAVGGRMLLMGYPIYPNYDFPRVQYKAGVTGQGNLPLAIFGLFPRFRIRYVDNTLIPMIVRDDVTGISRLTTRFGAIQFVDSKLRNYGTSPFGVLRNKA